MPLFRVGLLGMLLWTVATSSIEPAHPAPAAAQTERQAIQALTSRFLTSFENLDMRNTERLARRTLVLKMCMERG